MLIKIFLTIIIVSIIVFIITLLLVKTDVFFKKFIRSVTIKKEEFWLILDNITRYICFFSFFITISVGITLLMILIWG